MTAKPSVALSDGPLRAPLWLLVLMTVCGTMAMHMVVPALPAAGRDLGASITAMQSTISLYIIGLAVGQLIYGPIADALGRRPVVIFGLLVYVVAGLAAAFAPHVQALIAARVLQALGGCAGLVLSRVIVRDTSGSTDVVKRLALMNLITMIGPGIAPLLGAGLTSSLGWRSIFVALALLGAVSVFFVWRILSETGRPTGSLQVGSLMRDYSTTLRTPTFAGFALGGSCATMAIYAVVVAVPFILVQELQRPDHESGVVLLLVMFMMASGNMLTSRLVSKVPLEKILVRANLLSLVSALGFVITTLSGGLSIWTAGAFMCLFALGVGMSGPGAITKAISVNPRLTGTAAGLYGACQMCVGALATSLVGLGDSPALASGGVLVVAGIIAQTSLRTAMRAERRLKRHADHHPT